MGSGTFPIQNPKLLILIISVFIFGITLYTNQYFHGGVWGTLHNKSVKPNVEISNLSLSQSDINFEIYRTEGADVYGSFLIGIHILDKNGNIIKELNHTELSKFRLENIKNHYVAKVKPGKHSLIIPLGAKADLTLNIEDIIPQKDKIHSIKLIDISGIEWTAKL